LSRSPYARPCCCCKAISWVQSWQLQRDLPRYPRHGWCASHLISANTGRFLGRFDPDGILVLPGGVVSVLTPAGLFYRYKRGLTIVAAFLIPYAAIVVLWPFSPGIRLVFPFIPWIVFLALTGLRGLTENFARRHVSTAVCAFLLLISIPFVTAYRNTDFGLIRQNTGPPEFNQLCQAVREQTTPQDVLIYFRARALALYTSRTTSAYNHQGTDEELWQYARNVHATHLITSNAFDEDHGFLACYAETHSSNLELAHQNANFKLYRIVADAAPLASARSHSPATSQAPPEPTRGISASVRYSALHPSTPSTSSRVPRCCRAKESSVENGPR
jgi:hypothetical protein